MSDHADIISEARDIVGRLAAAKSSHPWTCEESALLARLCLVLSVPYDVPPAAVPRTTRSTHD